MKTIILLSFIFLSCHIFAQNQRLAITQDGKVVILHPNGQWEEAQLTINMPQNQVNNANLPLIREVDTEKQLFIIKKGTLVLGEHPYTINEINSGSDRKLYVAGEVYHYDANNNGSKLYYNGEEIKTYEGKPDWDDVLRGILKHFAETVYEGI